METGGCGCIVIVTAVCRQGDPPVEKRAPGKPPRIPCLFKSQESRLLSEQESPYLPPLISQQKNGGDPEAFILGISSLPRVETTSIVSSQSRVGRGPSSRRKLAGGGLEQEGEGDPAKSEQGKGLPRSCWRLGSGVPKGRDWLPPPRMSGLSQPVDPCLIPARHHLRDLSAATP